MTCTIDRTSLETNSGLYNWKLNVLVKVLRGTTKTIIKEELGRKGKILLFLYFFTLLSLKKNAHEA